MAREDRADARRDRVSARNRAENHKSGFDRTLFQPPDGVKMFQVKAAGVKRIDILYYRVGKGNPFADPGKLHYERTFYTHRGIGAADDSYLCPAKTFNMPCPVCEARAEMSRKPDADSALIKELGIKERQLFWVFDHGEPQLGWQIWENSFHLFGKQLDARIKNSDQEDGYQWFADPEEGFTLRIGFDEKSTGAYKFLECSSIDFKPRAQPYTMADVEKLAPLDDMLIQIPYNKLKAIFLQVPFDGDTTAPATGGGAADAARSAPAAGGNAERKVEPKYAPGTKVEHDTHGVCEVLRVSTDGETYSIEDSKGDTIKGVDVKELFPVTAKKKEEPKKPDPAPATNPVLQDDKVYHKEKGKCTVARVSSDGQTLTLEDTNGDFHKGIDVSEIKRGWPPAEVTADAKPAPAVTYAKGDKVSHPKHGPKCEIIKVADDGLVLEDAKGDFHKGIQPSECGPVGADAPAKEEKPKAETKPKKEEKKPDPAPTTAPADASGDNWDDWDPKS